jgi:hypothetical protein
MALVDEKRCGLSEHRNNGFGTVHALTSVEEKMIAGDRRDDSSSGSLRRYCLCICFVAAIILLLVTAIRTLRATMALGMLQTPPGFKWSQRYA